ncbi:MAG: hypothetical protein N2691_04860 [Patescibacteria group bacterium]|nr:hypothetical protein [Patescibacteria group bacterium]
MKKILYTILIALTLLVLPLQSHASDSLDYFEITRNAITPIPCGTSESRSCPKEMDPIYQKLGEPCARSFQEFQRYPTTRHFWIEDPKITAQGKANERARQFIYWAINNRAIDDHPVLREIWGITSSVAFFFVILVAAIFGLGFIMSRRANFTLNLELWPTLIKIGIMLLYIALSASVVLLLIQLSEILMRFFIDNLGGRDLFNIYFSNTGSLGSSERNYTDFVGCRDLNLRVQESINTKLFLYDLTNMTYYIMGTMIILRKILLWFLLFVAPFLALLMPFVFIRNIGWIWIGVFFQWLMYGPLFALFLGALAKIWKAGIPFTFDFSRVIPTRDFANAANPLIGYTYPTAINILYGGPAQIGDRRLSAINSGSYVDTFTEYVITLIMLWAVTFFPWWLLRIFRDYCCDGIYAMKNVLFEMYNEIRESNNPVKKGPTPTFDLKHVLKVPTDTKLDTKFNVKLASMEHIRNTSTADITKSLNIQVTKLTDIARIEADQTRKSAVQKNLAALANPAQVSTTAEKQQFMNMRTELFNRAIKQDSVARRLLSSTSNSSYERDKIREELVKTIQSNVKVKTSATISAESMDQLSRTLSASIKAGSVSGATSSSSSQVSASAFTGANATITLSDKSVSAIAKSANVSAEKTRTVLQALARSQASSINQAVRELAKRLNLQSDTVKSVIEASITHQAEKTQNVMTKFMNQIEKSDRAIQTIANRAGLTNQQVRAIVSAYSKSMNKPANQVVPSITVVAKVEESKVKAALNIMGTMFMTRDLILNFSEENKVEAEKVEQAVAAVASASGDATGPDSPEVSGPQGGPPEQPTKTEAELQVSAVTGEKGKEAEAGSDQGVGAGPAPTPTDAEKQLAEKLAQEALKNEAIREQAGVTDVKPENAPVVVRKVLRVISDNTRTANEVVAEVAKREDVKVEEAAEIVKEQLEITAKPEENIEKIVAVPPSVTIEEYEELKEMWEHQYEEGEIPVQENIQSREEWVESDIVTITNVMNKILSPNPEIQQQGLDELGFIIPIFMINNLKGDQLITYLKAKLEAAKTTRKILERENRLRRKLEKKQEEEEDTLLELKTNKKEEPKLMQMDLPEEKGPTTIEERAQVEVQAAPEINKAYLEQQSDTGDNDSDTGTGNTGPANGDTGYAGERKLSWDHTDKTNQPLKEYGAEEGGLKEYGSDEPKLKEYGADDEKNKEW